MALSAAAVGRVPVDVAAALNLDGDRVVENLGQRPLRFVVAEAAGEAAPADLGAGQLLQPGQRETVRTTAGQPLWAWSPFPTRIGVGPAWAAAATARGGGLSLIYAGAAAETALAGAHASGATVLSVADASVLRAGRVYVGGEIHTIEAVDAVANTATIAAPGLTADQADGAPVGHAPLVGTGDVLALPAGPWAELDVRLLYDMPRTGGGSFYNGRSSGAFYSDGAVRSSWVETLSNFSYWFAFGNAEPALQTYSVGLLHATAGLANAWTVEFDPATHELSLVQADPNTAASFLPRVYDLIVAGRRA